MLEPARAPGPAELLGRQAGLPKLAVVVWLVGLIPQDQQSDRSDTPKASNMPRREELGSPRRRPFTFCGPSHSKHWKRLGLAGLRRKVGGGGGALLGLG